MSDLDFSGAQQETEKDTLGGGFLVDSGLHNCIIETAFMSKSTGGASAVNLHLKTATGAVIRQTVYISNKQGSVTYTDKQDGSIKNLPGFNQMNVLCELACGLTLQAAVGQKEEKVIKLYDFNAKKEVPTKVDMLMPLLGQPITLGILKVIENKNVKNDAGVYVVDPSGAKRESNEIDKCFRASDGLTKAEIQAGETVAEFKAKWEKKNTGVDKNKYKEVAGTGTAGAPPTSGAPAGGAGSLFSD